MDYVFGICVKWIPMIVLITMIDVFAKCHAYIVGHHILRSYAIKKKKRNIPRSYRRVATKISHFEETCASFAIIIG